MLIRLLQKSVKPIAGVVLFENACSGRNLDREGSQGCYRLGVQYRAAAPPSRPSRCGYGSHGGDAL